MQKGYLGCVWYANGTGQDGTGRDGTGQDILFCIMFGMLGTFGTEQWTVLLYVWYGRDRTGQGIQMTKVSLFV